MKIGITYTGPHGTGSDEKQQNYLNWLHAGNLNGFELVTLFPEDGIPDLYEYAGILFSGGIDVEPLHYGLGSDYANAPPVFNKVRDQFEKALFRQTQEMGLPVLGICRGMQLINVLQGGTLKRDLGESKNETHRAIPADKKHHAKVEERTLLSEIANAIDNTITVNSAHHQAVDRLAASLKISCYSDDGEPEALEWDSPEGKPFLLCVQWHPERMFRFELENEPASAGIRDRFVSEIIKYSKAHENI